MEGNHVSAKSAPARGQEEDEISAGIVEAWEGLKEGGLERLVGKVKEGWGKGDGRKRKALRRLLLALRGVEDEAEVARMVGVEEGGGGGEKEEVKEEGGEGRSRVKEEEVKEMEDLQELDRMLMAFTSSSKERKAGGGGEEMAEDWEKQTIEVRMHIKSLIMIRGTQRERPHQKY